MSTRRLSKSPKAGSTPGSPQPPAGTEQPLASGEQPTTAQIPFDERDDGDDADSAIGDTGSNLTSASLTESIFDYRLLHGRTYQNSKTTEYWGPNDDRQNDGLDIAHHFVTMAMGDQLFEAPIGSSPSKILDVGTGTGIWAIDMADAYPSAEVIGTDISPIQPTWVPPNCFFRVEDAQLEWIYPPDTLDFVHIRALLGCIDDWPQLYRQVHTALAPGGWFEHYEFNVTIYSDVPEVRDDPNHIFKRWAAAAFEAADRIGKTLRIGMGDRISKLMSEAGFVNVVQKHYHIPSGAWSSDPKMKTIGAYNLAFLDASLEGFMLFLLREVMQWQYEEIQVFLMEMRKAIRNPKIRPYYVLTNSYGQKPKATV